MAASELTQWLDAAARIPRITPAQEIMLGRQVQAAQAARELPAEERTLEQERMARRGLRAQQRLAEANLRLVWTIVMGTPARPSAYSRSVPAHVLPDLLQMGAEGVFHAASKYNPEAGYRFSTYAACWIRERCQKELDQMGRPIRVPTTLTNAARRLPRVQAGLMQHLGRMPAVDELAGALGLSISEARLLVQRLRPVLSLDQVGGEDGRPLGDLIAAPECSTAWVPPRSPPPAPVVRIVEAVQLTLLEVTPALPSSHTSQGRRVPPQARRHRAIGR